ncbi:PEPxxWA-CTERM sorting domain-containing protein [Phenylobacterium sp.]|uniref:PEPxxWA-CTERM sorting domain-containing protein n=1 Tax=Phenylobacterium sp. TaxID=1871053 RepID=UPI00356746C5
MKMLTAILLAAGLAAGPAFAGTIITPAGPGDAQGPAPINYYGSGGSQVQQIYDASYFAGPTQITGLSFRAYPGAAPSGFFSNTVNVSNLTVALSNTMVSANEASGAQPSTNFAANEGANLTTVFSGAVTLSTAATGQGPQPFDYTVNFTTPFLYDPSGGNLLVDFLIPQGATVSGSGFGFLTFDTANDLNDGVTSVVNLQGPGPAGTLSTAAAITQFHTASAAAVPEPASWALMIGGMLMTGGALRARRRIAASPLTA